MAEPNNVIEGLGSFPIIQAVIGAIIAFGAAYGWKYGERKARSSPPNDTQIYLDGPFANMISHLEGIYRLMLEVRNDLSKADERRERNRADEVQILRTIADGVKRRR